MNTEAYRNRKLLDLCQGKTCCNCGSEDGTSVPAHSNQSIHGKGAHRKAEDSFSCPLCYMCHSWLDQGGTSMDPTGTYEPTRAAKAEMWNRAYFVWQLKLWECGFVRLA
jgi:hypothetical protein